MLTSAMMRRLLLAFITLAVIGVLAAEGSAIAAVFPSNVSLAAHEQALHPLASLDHAMPVTAV